MKIPTNLMHKPVIVCENYENIDGRNAYKSDAKGLSLGLAQWNDRGKVDISAKVWRHTGEKWSRHLKNCRCTGCWIWLFSSAEVIYTSRKHTVILNSMIRKSRGLIGLAFKVMQ